MAKRIGPRMAEVVAFVTRNPGLSMMRAAAYVGPNGSLNYGYRTVWRAYRAGLIETTRGPRGARLCWLPGTAGKAVAS